MVTVVEPLPWDTEFFGFAIGKVDLDGAGLEDLDALDEEARSAGLVCLYGSLDPADAPATMVVQEHGFRFVEAATTFSLRVDEPPIPAPEGISVRVGGPDDLASLREASDALASWSRFAVDPRFGLDAARRLQWAWIERAARSETGEHELVLAELGGEIVAFITRCTAPSPRVDSVWTAARGSGAARYLIEDARRWAGDQPLLGGPIAARNIPALRYVSHCGYRVSTVRYLYHRWFDDAAPA
jgi:dTDP-4-amino-4,6-dideoxy-D-galactose acyltransferase